MFFLDFLGSYDGTTEQILRRTNPDIPDLLIAFLSGMAAAYCFSRPKLVSALAGVAIAAALVPPIATTGIGIALGEPEYCKRFNFALCDKCRFYNPWELLLLLLPLGSEVILKGGMEGFGSTGPCLH